MALARILASEPRAILLDEPFSALDSFLKWNLELELAELLGEFDGPILWVSHDLGECYRNCYTVCVMENGRSGAITDMDTLAHHPTTQGTAQLAGCRNFFPAEGCENGVRPVGWDVVLPLTAPQKTVTVAVPDDAILLGEGPYKGEVWKIIKDLNATVVLLRPENAQKGPALRALLPVNMTAQPGDHVAFALLADKCLCYGG